MNYCDKMNMVMQVKKTIWTCPQCGNSFLSVNTSHECPKDGLDILFQDSEPHIRSLFLSTLSVLHDIHDFHLTPRETDIILHHATHEIGSLEVGRSHLLLTLHSTSVRVVSEEDLDAGFREWVVEATAEVK